MPKILPAIFFGHGNPMNAVLDNGYTKAWSRIGQTTPKPKAILSISAHWFVSETGVTIATSPRTIHDFGGFPRELFQVQYPAPGDPNLARRVQKLLAPLEVKLDNSWGLDHGTWSVLRHVYPDADIPVVQLSIDENKPASFHFEIGKKLAALREEGILRSAVGSHEDWAEQEQEKRKRGKKSAETARKYISVSELADITGVSPQRIYEMIKLKKLKAVKIGMSLKVEASVVNQFFKETNLRREVKNLKSRLVADGVGTEALRKRIYRHRRRHKSEVDILKHLGAILQDRIQKKK